MSGKAWFICIGILTSLPDYVTTSAGADTAVSTPGASQEDKLRQVETELERLRNTVTELQLETSCESQSGGKESTADLLEEIHTIHAKLQSLQVQQELSTLRSEVQAVRSVIKSDSKTPASPPNDNGLQEKQVNKTLQPPLGTGAVYKRWGHGECPEGAELVYSGVIGGSYYNDTGAAGNTLCLPLNPVLENVPVVEFYTHIVGAEFQVNPLPPHDLDPKCTVCRVPRATVVMVPAAKTCHEGWTLEYTGYIMAGHHTQKAATEFICMDSAMQGRAGSSNNDNGKLFYYVTTSCGSLPCPPYESKKIITCAVCTK